MKRLYFKFSLWAFLVIIFLQMNGSRACLEKERIGLLEFKAFMKSNCEVDDNLDSWVEDGTSDCCDWDRVTCSSTSRRVVDLSLYWVAKHSSLGITCSLNLSMFYPFEELLSLDFSNNWFNGWIDKAGSERAALGLKKLEILDLSDNSFNNSILSFVGILTSIKTLNLSGNALVGLFPVKDLAYLENLETLEISSNEITGLSVEDFDRLSSLKKLKVVDLGSNTFNTSSLSSLGCLVSLKILVLSGNNMDGLFSFKELGDLKNLETLDLSYNELESLSMEGFERLSSLKKLKFLDLSYNVLNGSAMSALSNLVSLKTLILNSNGMVGQLPPSTELANMKHLETLDISYNSLEGSEGLCGLKRLTELDLKNNKFSGPLPQCLGNISNLQYLDLSSNQFTGNMESILSKLTSLKCLVLSGNNFEGLFSFSALANHSKLEIFELSSGSSKLEVDTENPTWFPTFQLKLFHLSNCHLNVQTRTVPSFLLYQHDMNFIDLSHNKLTGAFPSWVLQNNSKLQVMNLMNNSFAGSFQLPNFNHRDLVKLEISSNNITGQLPKEFGLVLSNLCYINMSRNSFHGNVPSSVGEIRQLRYMDLSYNNFSGVLPGSILGNGTDLYYLYLSNNNFNCIGGESSSISAELFVLDMSNNKLSDTIPLQLCNMVSLKILDLSENRLHGSLPSCFNSPRLQFLFLQKNSLSGSIPYVLPRSPSLVALDLRDNKFTGNLPTWINQLSELRVLSLGANPLGGHLPEQLCELRNVSILDLSRNLLSGSIPSCFNNISFGNVREQNNFEYTPKILGDFLPFTFYYSLYDGTLEFEVEELFHMSSSKEVEVEFAMKYKYNPYKGDIVNLLAGIDLSCNELNGSIPSEFGDLHEILSLNLSRNHLSGYIPISFSNLESLESLDLSFNNLSGEIPSQLVALSFLETFNVSYNNLSGRIPDEGQFGTFDESSYRGNPGLCGPIVNRSCDAAEVPPTPPSNDKEEEEEEEGGVDMAWFNWSFNASYVTIVFVLMVTLRINREWRMLWFYWVDVCIYYISIQLFGTDRLCL